MLALLQRKTLIETKKSHIKILKMLKMALFNCAIKEKCCSVYGGRGICPLVLSPPQGICHPRQKNINAQGSARVGVVLGAGEID